MNPGAAATCALARSPYHADALRLRGTAQSFPDSAGLRWGRRTNHRHSKYAHRLSFIPYAFAISAARVRFVSSPVLSLKSISPGGPVKPRISPRDANLETSGRLS